MIIEFIGLPGTGKTTLVNSFSRNNTSISIEEINLFYFSLYFIMHVPFFLYLIIFSEKYHYKSSLKYFFYHIRLCSSYRNLHANSVLDQGVYQSFCSMLIFTREVYLFRTIFLKAYLFLYFRLFKCKLYYLNIDANITIERLLNRKSYTSRFELMGGEELTFKIEKFKNLIEFVYDLYDSELRLVGNESFEWEISSKKISLELAYERS
jgi:hypothetical protein